MYQVGEFIVHPGQGVCRVEDVSSGPDATYKLLPVGQRHAVHISFPVSNESRLRPILSAEEAREIIDQYPRMDVDDYADRNNSLEEQHFKQEIRNGSCRDTVRVAKTFSARIAEVEGRNKKPPWPTDASSSSRASARCRSSAARSTARPRTSRRSSSRASPGIRARTSRYSRQIHEAAATVTFSSHLRRPGTRTAQLG